VVSRPDLPPGRAVPRAKAAAAGDTVTLEVTAGVPHVFVAMVGLLEEASLALDQAATPTTPRNS